MTDTTNTPRATPTQIKAYFEVEGRKVTLAEMKELKGDAKGYSEIATGIADGTLTY